MNLACCEPSVVVEAEVGGSCRREGRGAGGDGRRPGGRREQKERAT